APRKRSARSAADCGGGVSLFVRRRSGGGGARREERSRAALRSALRGATKRSRAARRRGLRCFRGARSVDPDRRIKRGGEEPFGGRAALAHPPAHACVGRAMRA